MEVNQIISYKFINNILYYLVHWKESQHDDNI
jgi:hypothetical protein